MEAGLGELAGGSAEARDETDFTLVDGEESRRDGQGDEQADDGQNDQAPAHVSTSREFCMERKYLGIGVSFPAC